MTMPVPVPAQDHEFLRAPGVRAIFGGGNPPPIEEAIP